VFGGPGVMRRFDPEDEVNVWQKTAAVKSAMKVNVPESEFDHLWEEPPAGNEEFWAFRFPPKAQPGDQVLFHMNKKPVAEAVISRIEKPGEHECEATGRFKNKWKVYWTPESFKKIASSPVRSLTREQAIAILRKANENGKNKGSDALDDFSYIQPGAYVLVSLPLAELDYVQQNEDREQFYAGVPGDFPPVFGRFSARAKKRHQEDGSRPQVGITNGNHRCCAAELRGDATIPVIMPAAEYELFQGTVGSPEAKAAASKYDGNVSNTSKTASAYPLAPRDEWYGNCNYKDAGGRMVQMSPDAFLAAVRPLTLDDTSRENIDDLKQHIESGRTLDPLTIYADGKEDGRHRAYAAKELGIKSVPVLDFRMTK